MCVSLVWLWHSPWYSKWTGHQLPQFVFQVFINPLVIQLKIWGKYVWRDPISLVAQPHHTRALASWYYVTSDESWPICMLLSVPQWEEEPFFCHLLHTEPQLPTAPIDFNWLEVQLLSQSRHKEEHSGPASSDSQLGYTSSLVQIGEPKTR